ncbi:anti-sigma factor domain-containing protein [Neobacillus massiliamazoniensis]|uniref:SigmaI modulating factor n=1 Tax=Neobacillus massiliamazoniensis TaxID=1499688 RepID=A0A0U1NRM7_9BACI|nr:anti-sigma factor domain-containing protein [Neobacillus massiliamazoniensis]CRK80701.1 sigmaI modulating factor [Neobacillus massiliamazoniensis]
MKKGIVMEIDDAFLTLLTPEGEFLRTRNQKRQYIIGEEITFFPISSDNASRSIIMRNLLKRKTIWAICVMTALFIFLGSMIPMNQDNKAYAYMSIDVNPSIELGINKKMQVVELNGFNKEGKKIISAITNWKNKDVSQLAKIILNEMKKEGYLKSNQPIIISTVRTNGSEQQVEAKLNENLNEIKAKANEERLEVTLYKGTEEEREKAHHLGITTGKYYENQMESNLTEQRKDNSKQELENKNLTPTQPSELILPPGQVKKQSENNTPRADEPVNNGVKNNEKHGDDNFIPPGQLKKMDEDQTNQNYGQMKKQEEFKENPKQNYGQKKKQEEINQNQNHKPKHDD